MQKLILNIEDSHYRLLLQFLKTLDYVQIVQPSTSSDLAPPESELTPAGQLEQLQQRLQQLSRPLFDKITDPVIWQKQQRD